MPSSTINVAFADLPQRWLRPASRRPMVKAEIDSLSCAEGGLSGTKTSPRAKSLLEGLRVFQTLRSVPGYVVFLMILWLWCITFLNSFANALESAMSR